MAAGVCAEHSGVCADIRNIKEQTDNNTREIKTLSDAIIKLTTLVEALDSRSEPAVKQPFWDGNTKKYALKLGFILCVVLICALVGINLIGTSDLINLTK